MVLKKLKKHGAKFSAYVIAFFCLNLALWIDKNFGSPSFEQILLHVKFGVDGLVEADQRLIQSFIFYCGILPVLFSLFIFVIQKAVLSQTSKTFIHNYYKNRTGHDTAQVIAKLLTITRIAFHNFLPIIVICVGAFALFTKLAIWSHIQTFEESMIFEQYYVEPAEIIAPQIKKNLVTIYVESFENGFSNSTIMGEDVLSPLNSVLEKAYSFDNYLQTYGTGFTIAGLVSTQCGIPLKIFTTLDGQQQGEKLKKFLPGAICLGDILSTFGYTNVFLQGSSLAFAGKDKFYSQHGYSKMLGKSHWLSLGDQALNEWGIFDDQLLKYAKQELDLLQASGRPFNLSILTSDTHFPKGHISASCKNKGVTNYQGVVKCTASEVANFISYIKDKGYLENTVVVVLGDHLAMRVPMLDELEKAGNRTIYNRILTNEVLNKNTETLYPFSMYPTMLYSLGFRFKHNRLGLGASGFGEVDPNYDLTAMSPVTFRELLAKSSRGYNLLLNADDK